MKIILIAALAVTAAWLDARPRAILPPATAAQTQTQTQTAEPPAAPLPRQPADRQTAPAGLVARGEYIVNSVAMCVQCHSPRTPDGTIIQQQKLGGAPMPVRGPLWIDEWAFRAPTIAGLPGFTDDQIIMLLTEGRAGPDREPPTPPMPPFRMAKDDARAVVAYLRSLAGR